MHIVIDIDEETYNEVCCRGLFLCPRDKENLVKAIKNGIPLPKGHGRLIDESDLMPDSDYEDGTFYAVSIGQINLAPTIIEADKERE